LTEIEGEPFDASTHGWALWDLFVFEPWFLIEGILFIAAGGAALGTHHARLSWLRACLAGIAIATVTGLLGVRL